MDAISPKDIKAKDIMTKTLKTVDANAELKDAISILNRDRIHHLVVYEGKTYAGMFGYKELGKVYRQPKYGTKVRNLTSKPPLLPEDTNIVDIVDYMYRLNYKIMPIGSDKNVVGVVSERDILNAIIKYGLLLGLSGKTADNFMTSSPTVIKQEDHLVKAIVALRENNISRLPVVDAEGRITGILESLDVIKFLAAKENLIKDSGSSPHPKYDGMEGNIPENVLKFDIPIDSLASSNFVRAKRSDLIADKIKENVNLDTTSIVVVDDREHPIGIIAPKDIIQFIAQLKETKTENIQISGLENQENIDEFQKNEIHSIIDRTVKKIANITNIRNITIHTKSHDTLGKRAKYSFRCKLHTDKDGQFFANTWGWDPIEATSSLMDEIESQVLENTKKRSEIFRRKSRDAKKHGGS